MSTSDQVRHDHAKKPSARLLELAMRTYQGALACPRSRCAPFKCTRLLVPGLPALKVTTYRYFFDLRGLEGEYQ